MIQRLEKIVQQNDIVWFEKYLDASSSLSKDSRDDYDISRHVLFKRQEEMSEIRIKGNVRILVHSRLKNIYSPLIVAGPKGQNKIMDIILNPI